MTDTYSFDEPVVEEKLSFDESSAPPALPKNILDNRAVKLDIALGQDSPGFEALAVNLAGGAEPNYRSQLAAREALKFRDYKLGLISQVAARKGGPLTPEEQDYIMKVVKSPGVSPDMVLEHLYARSFVNSALVHRQNEGTVLSRALNEDPAKVAQYVDAATTLSTKKEIAQTLFEDVKNRWDKEGFGTKAAYSILDYVPFLNRITDYQLHNIFKEAPAGSFLPGTNLGEQVRWAWMTDPQTFQQVSRQAVNDLYSTNPNAAFRLAQALVSYGTSEAVMSNVSLGLEAVTVAPVGRILGKAIGMKPAVYAKDPVSGPVDQPFFHGIRGADEPRAQPSPLDKSQPFFHGVVGSDETNFVPIVRGKEPQQLDLFPYKEPTFGREFDQTSVKPGLPPGKMRASMPNRFETYQGEEGPYQLGTNRKEGPAFRDEKGRIRKTPVQLEMELPPGSREWQFSFDFDRAARIAVHDIVKANEAPKPDSQDVLSTIGDTKRAADTGAVRILNAKSGAIETADDLFEVVRRSMPHYFNPSVFFKNGSVLSAARANELAANAEKRSEALTKGLTGAQRADRLPPEQIAAAIEEEKARLAKEFRFAESRVVNIEHNPAETNPVNITTVSVYLGDEQKLPFKRPEQAHVVAKDVLDLPEGGYKVKQFGEGFFIEVRTPIDETGFGARGEKIGRKYNNPEGTGFRLLDYIRSAEDTLSEFQRKIRHLAQHAPAELRLMLREQAKADLASLSKKKRNDLHEILRDNQRFENKDTNGRYYQTAAELEQAYQRRFGRLPDEAEIKAYNTYVRLNDFEYLMDELAWLRDKQVRQVQNYRIKLDNGEGLPIDSPWFNGKLVPDMEPRNPQNATILYRDNKSGKQIVFTKHDKNSEAIAALKEINERIAAGEVQIIQIYNPKDRPLKEALGGSKAQVNFVVTDRVQSKPIRLGENAEYTPGGHRIYQHQWYLKQPILEVGPGGVLTYYGDLTLKNFSSRAQAEKFAQKYTEAINLYKQGKTTELDDFVAKNLPEDAATFRGLFKPGIGPGKHGMSAEHPVVVTSAGRDAFESNTWLRERYADARESSGGSYDLSATLDKRFIAERGRIINTVKELGSESNPVFKAEQAALIDPFMAMSQGIGGAMRRLWLNDYKIGAAEQWIHQYRNVLDVDINVARKNPIYWLYEAPFLRNVEDRNLLNSAVVSRRNILNFVGLKSELAADISHFEQKMMNGIYHRFGDHVADKVSATMLPFIKDPFTYMRAIAFHTQLGFFNPVQYLVQAQAFNHIFFVSGPTNAIPALVAHILTRKLAPTDDPNITAHFSKIAAKFGWKAEQFLEAHAALKKLGFGHVGTETSWRNDIADPRMFIGGWQKFLDKGIGFFNAGERLVREAAFYSAYREWRKANPTAKLNNDAMGSIVTRADTLSVNMTRASNGALQEGVFAPMTQFYTFSQRLAEQFIGNRLTPAEKLRAFVGYSALYGVPISTSAMFGVWPFYDDIRKEALQKGGMYGFTIHDRWYQAVAEGLPYMLISMATGKEFDVNTRFGPGAPSILRDVWMGEKSPLDIFLGAGGSTIRDMAKSAYPFLHVMSGIFTDDNNYQLTAEDILAPLENIKTLGQGSKMMYGLNTGRYISKNGLLIDKDITPAESILMGVIGVTPKRVKDAQLGAAALKEWEKAQQQDALEVQKEIKKGLDAAGKEDWDAVVLHWKRAKSIVVRGGFTPEQQTQLFKQSMDGHWSLIERLNRDMIQKGPYQYKELRRLQMFPELKEKQ